MVTRTIDIISGETLLQKESGEAICAVGYQLRIEQDIQIVPVAGKAERIPGCYIVHGVIQVKPGTRLSGPVNDLMKHPCPCTIHLCRPLPRGERVFSFTPVFEGSSRHREFKIVSPPRPPPKGKPASINLP